ncbi:hypothetical protein ACQKNC_17755 [Lysinibacillus sp. NPDC094177]
MLLSVSMLVQSVASAHPSVADISIRRSGSSFRRYDISIRRFGSSIRR